MSSTGTHEKTAPLSYRAGALAHWPRSPLVIEIVRSNCDSVNRNRGAPCTGSGVEGDTDIGAAYLAPCNQVIPHVTRTHFTYAVRGVCSLRQGRQKRRRD
jgi:hypothetical protein